MIESRGEASWRSRIFLEMCELVYAEELNIQNHLDIAQHVSLYGGKCYRAKKI